MRLFAKASAEIRFLLAGGESDVTNVNTNNVERSAHADLHRARLEARRFGDIVFLSMSESRFECSRKSLLWFRYCEVHFPSAEFFAVADDDTYVQVAHLQSELRLVGSSGHVLWGLVT